MDWFVEFDRSDPGKTNGLEFVEGLWAEKLAIIAILATVAIIVVSIVWCVLGGNLQTVFTVMGFVLSLIAGKSCPMNMIYGIVLMLSKLKLHWRLFTTRLHCLVERESLTAVLVLGSMDILLVDILPILEHFILPLILGKSAALDKSGHN